MRSIQATDSTLTSVIPLKVTVKPSKSTGHASSTAKPSKVLKSSSGLCNEIHHSIVFHNDGIPLLVSSALLRSRNMGQIDLARLKKFNGKWIVEMAEVKSSQMGRDQMLIGQQGRLCLAQQFLAGIFGHTTRLIYLI